MDLKNQTILVTGGTGYIGSHTVVQLLEAGNQVVILDNLCNSKREVVNRIEQITGKRPDLVIGDIRDRATLCSLFTSHKIDAVIHFAGLKAVGESVAEPLKYYDNNVAGSVVLFEEMAQANVKTLVFSSSATVYGDPASVPISEDSALNPTNPYGHSKLVVEQILRDLVKSDEAWRVVSLRYFNPVGAHESGLIGESPRESPNNLMPYIAQVAIGQLKELSVFGKDYTTPDGTGIRDYIHVMDLADGHMAALNFLIQAVGWHAINLGTGKGYSVLEMVQAFEKASNRKVPYRVAARRLGDVAVCYADPSKAEGFLNWAAKRTLNDMCLSAWEFQKFVNS